MDEAFEPSRQPPSATAGIGKPIGFWIVPAVIVGVIGGVQALSILMTGRNLWLYFESPATRVVSLTHMTLLLIIQIAGVAFALIAFRAWSRHSLKQATWTTVITIALLVASYAVHLGFIYTYV